MTPLLLIPAGAVFKRIEHLCACGRDLTASRKCAVSDGKKGGYGEYSRLSLNIRLMTDQFLIFSGRLGGFKDDGAQGLVSRAGYAKFSG